MSDEGPSDMLASIPSTALLMDGVAEVWLGRPSLASSIPVWASSMLKEVVGSSWTRLPPDQIAGVSIMLIVPFELTMQRLAGLSVSGQIFCFPYIFHDLLWQRIQGEIAILDRAVLAGAPASAGRAGESKLREIAEMASRQVTYVFHRTHKEHETQRAEAAKAFQAPELVLEDCSEVAVLAEDSCGPGNVLQFGPRES